MKKIAALSNAMRGRISVATVPRPHFKVKLIDGQSQTEALKQTMALMLLANKKEEEN